MQFDLLGLSLMTSFFLSMHMFQDGSLLLQSENLNDSPSEISYERKHRRNSSNLSAAGSTITELTQAGDLINGSAGGAKTVCLRTLLTFMGDLIPSFLLHAIFLFAFEL